MGPEICQQAEVFRAGFRRDDHHDHRADDIQGTLMDGWRAVEREIGGILACPGNSKGRGEYQKGTE
jgi:hypothetical protein